MAGHVEGNRTPARRLGFRCDPATGKWPARLEAAERLNTSQTRLAILDQSRVADDTLRALVRRFCATRHRMSAETVEWLVAVWEPFVTRIVQEADEEPDDEERALWTAAGWDYGRNAFTGGEAS